MPAARISGTRSGASTSPASRSGSSVRARNDSPIVAGDSGRPSTTTGSPARTSPGSSTRRYAPGRPARVNRLIQPGRPICASNVTHGIRGEVTCSTSVSPTRQRSPITAPVTSRPMVVRFSPNCPARSGRPSCAAQASRSSRAYA